MRSRLFTTYYAEADPRRRAELDYCIAINAMAFDYVHVLSESMDVRSAGNIEFRSQPRRQTYSDLISWSGSACYADDLCVFANCDIAFSGYSADLMKRSICRDDAYCLSRYEVRPPGAIELYDFEWSQDTWAFLGPCRVVGGNYRFGVPGCDNRFAYELHAAGYRVLNPSRSIVTMHMHRSDKRTATNSGAHRLPPPYLPIWPHELGEVPRSRQVFEL